MAAQLPHLLSAGDVEQVTTLSRRAINRAIKAGKFPSPVKLTTTGHCKPRVAWRGTDVQAWLDALMTGANGGEAQQ